MILRKNTENVPEWAGETLARHFCPTEALVNGVGQYSFKPHLLIKANWHLGVLIFKVVVLARSQKCSLVYLLGNHELIPKCYVMR